MVAFGPEVIEWEDLFRGVNFNGEFAESRCHIQNNPFKEVMTHERKLNEFKDKWSFIRSCVEVHIEDEGPQPLNAPATQVGCKLTRFGKQKAMFNGGFCYFKPNYGSSYLVQFNIKKECLSQSGMNSLGINSYDITSALNFYISGDASGVSTNLKALSNTPVRISVNPSKELMTPSDDFGILYPTFPDEWAIPDVHFGDLKVTKLFEGRGKIEYSFLADNNCAKKCSGSFCQSRCDYAQPVVAEMSLYKELSSGKKEFLTSWYEGGVAPAHFQGFIRGIGFEVGSDLLEEGSIYTLEVNFQDPKFDFERFKKRLQNRLNTIDQQLGRISRSNIPQVQEIPYINTGREFPEFTGIPNLVFGRSLDTVSQAVNRLRSYFSFKLWPPYYARACGELGCQGIDDKLFSLKTKFKLGTVNQEDQSYKIEILSTSRKSKIASSYEHKSPKMSSLDCSINSGE